eukprot:38181_1
MDIDMNMGMEMNMNMNMDMDDNRPTSSSSNSNSISNSNRMLILPTSCDVITPALCSTSNAFFLAKDKAKAKNSHGNHAIAGEKVLNSTNSPTKQRV